MGRDLNNINFESIAYVYEELGFKGIYLRKEDLNPKEKLSTGYDNIEKSATDNSNMVSLIANQLKEHYNSFKNCEKCGLSKTRTQVVFGDGNVQSKVVFIGEAPGADEDAQGKPFVGRAGRYLNEVLKETNMPRSHIFITNIVKCRPPENRTPTLEEIQKCIPYLMKEIEILNPKMIVLLGKTAAIGVLGRKDISMTKERGLVKLTPKSFLYGKDIKVFLTYHPSYLLRNPSASKEYLEDMKKIKEELDLL